MSTFGGMDRGQPGDAPFLGRAVIYAPSSGAALPAIVTEVYADGWTVDLVGFRLSGGNGALAAGQMVPYGGNSGVLGQIERGTWVTPDQYEGAKIHQGEELD